MNTVFPRISALPRLSAPLKPKFEISAPGVYSRKYGNTGYPELSSQSEHVKMDTRWFGALHTEGEYCNMVAVFSLSCVYDKDHMSLLHCAVLFSLFQVQEGDNLWWDSFAAEFFEDDATLTLSFCLEDGLKRYSMLQAS